MYSGMSLGQILSSLAVPNNHPANTILVNYCMSIFAEPWTIRLPAFFFGLLAVVLAGVIARMISRNYYTAFIAMGLLTFNGVAIHYSQTARGYSMQGAMILLFILFTVLYFNADKETIQRKLLIASGSLVSGIIAVLTLPTSVLFLFPVCAWHGIYILINSWKEKRHFKKLFSYWPVLGAYSILGLFILLWLLGNYTQLKQAQGFGSSITSASAFFAFIFTTFSSLCPAWSYIACVPLLFLPKNKRAYLWLGGSFIIFPLLGALFFKAGPPRVYFPMVPVLCLAAGAGMAYLPALLKKLTVLKIRNYAYKVLLVLFFAGYAAHSYFMWKDWTMLDWKKIFNEYIKKQNQDCYFIYYPTSSFPALYNNGNQIIQDNIKRVNSVKENSLLVVLESEKNISGLNKKSSVKDISMPATMHKFNCGVRCNYYKLKKLPMNPDKGKDYTVLCVIKPVEKKIADFARAYLWQGEKPQWLLLNCWFSSPCMKDGKYYKTHSLLAKLNGNAITELKNIQLKSNNIFMFYCIEPIQTEI
jgi:hypothetical protein